MQDHTPPQEQSLFSFLGVRRRTRRSGQICENQLHPCLHPYVLSPPFFHGSLANTALTPPLPGALNVFRSQAPTFVPLALLPNGQISRHGSAKSRPRNDAFNPVAHNGYWPLLPCNVRHDIPFSSHGWHLHFVVPRSDSAEWVQARRGGPYAFLETNRLLYLFRVGRHCG